ncbi:MAG: hypothetical protein IPN17_31105 [Deltaproteobacteria bacterium]|nr:hypothetical protein [Deltaproteobacteria bacterium]
MAQHVSVLGSAARGVWLRAGGSFAAGASVSVQRAAVGAAAVDDVNDVAALPLQPLRESETRDVLLTGGQATLRRDAVWGGATRATQCARACVSASRAAPAPASRSPRGPR